MLGHFLFCHFVFRFVLLLALSHCGNQRSVFITQWARSWWNLCPSGATCLPMLGTLLAQKCIVFGLKGTGLLPKRYVVSISKKHGYYPKKNMFATQKKPFTTQRNILTTPKDKISVGLSWTDASFWRNRTCLFLFPSHYMPFYCCL